MATTTLYTQDELQKMNKMQDPVTGQLFDLPPQLKQPTTPTTNLSGGTPTKTPEQVAADLAKENVAKTAGQADVSVDDFTKYFSSAGLSKEETDKIKSDLGLTTVETAAFAPPSKTTEQIYNDAYASAGLADIKKKVSDLLTEINTRKDQLNQRLLKIDDNPWLSEASRSKAVMREKDFFERSISNLTDQVNALNTTYTQGLGEVNNLVTRQSSDFKDTLALNQAKLTYLAKKAENAISAEQSSRIAKYLPTYLQAKIAATKPGTIGTAETGFYKWNPTTGKFEQVIKGTGKTPTSKEQLALDIQDMKTQLDIAVRQNKVRGSTDNYLSPDQYDKAKRAWLETGTGNGKDFDNIFSYYRNPNDPKGYNLD